jgi:hypothetical protein
VPDLIEKYFREDLTEAEEQDLSRTLWESEDSAEQFAARAEEAYYRYGFPPPHWVHPPNVLPGMGFGIPWGMIGGVLALTGALLWGLFHFYPQLLKPIFPHASIPSVLTVEKTGSPSVPQASIPGSIPTSFTGRLSPKPQDHLKESLGQKNEKGSSTGSSGAGPDLETVALTPTRLEDNASRTYSSLTAIVHLSQSSAIQVRVVDMRGLEITPLYSGILGEGHWAFEWNGHLSNRQPASRGFYQIEVKSGTYVQRKSIEIR